MEAKKEAKKEIKISSINDYSKEDQEIVYVNDFSFNQNSLTEYHTEINQFKCPKYAKNLLSQDINFLKCDYIGMNVSGRLADLKALNNKASEKVSRFIDLSLTTEELNTLVKDPLPEIDNKFKSTKKSISLIKDSIDKFQEQLNSNSNLGENYDNLFNKQIDVMRYTENFYRNPYVKK